MTEPSTESPKSQAWQTRAAWVCLAVFAVPRVWAAVWDQSQFWPDEIFQTLEQAHRLAFGRGLVPWEFRDGARSWLFPGAIGTFWKLLAACGVSRALTLVVTVKLVMAALGVLSLELARRIATTLGGATAGLAAVLLVGACPPLIFYGSRAMTEVASIPLILGAVHVGVVARTRRPALAGALASASIFLRYQNGIVAVALLAMLLVRRERAAAIRLSVSGAVVALLCGLLDWPTWGWPFKAFWVYVDFNLIHHGSSGFGTAPWHFFLDTLAGSIGPSIGVLGFGLAFAVRRARALVILVVVYVVLHSAIPHKELRFMLPMLPLAVTLAAVGLVDAAAFFKLPTIFLPLALALLATGFMARRASHPLGRWYGGGEANASLWHNNEDYYRLQLEAADRLDLCGIALVGNYWAWTGGYTYLHRDVNVYVDLDHLANVNAVVAKSDDGLPAGWRAIATRASWSLFVRPGTCARDPKWNPNM